MGDEDLDKDEESEMDLEEPDQMEEDLEVGLIIEDIAEVVPGPHSKIA